MSRAHPQASPAEALHCLSLPCFILRSKWMVGWLLWQRMEETFPLCMAALTQQQCSVLVVQTFLSLSLGPSPETWAGSTKQEWPPISCRAGFLHSSQLWHIYTMSALELLGARVDAWRSLSVGEGLNLWADAQSLPFLHGEFPTLVQGRGFLAGCIPPPLGLFSSFAPLVSQTEVSAVSTV